MFIGTGRDGNKDCWFTYTYDTAVKDIADYIKEDVAQIPLLLPKDDRRYYITPTGKAFVARPVAGRIAVLTCAPRRGKRGEPYLALGISKNTRKTFSIAKCVYNSFVRKVWDESPVIHRDGNKYNYALDNLESQDSINPQIVDIHIESYMSRFERLTKYCMARFGVSEPDAKDVVQDAYLFVFSNQYKFGRLAESTNSDYEIRMKFWWRMAINRSINMLHRYSKYTDLLEVQNKVSECSEYPDFIQLVKRKREVQVLSLYLKGYEYDEIAQILGFGNKRQAIEYMSVIRRKLRLNQEKLI